MPVKRNIPPLPPFDVPFVDSAGKVSNEWYQWLVSLIAVLNEMRSAIP